MLHTEIERKYLIKGEFKSFSKRNYLIKQGYLSLDPYRTIRVRIKGENATLTIKGMSNENGISRLEWEKNIDYKEALELLDLCIEEVITKIRYIVPINNGLFFEIDEFLGRNKGLTIAEIELPYEDYNFEKPDWLGKEVSLDEKYYNVYLVKKPFETW